MNIFKKKLQAKNVLVVGNKGFTLIELLVVISIIALLSSVVLASLKNARERAKATAFRTEVNQLINALELYKSDNGAYPMMKDSEGQDIVTEYVITLSSEGILDYTGGTSEFDLAASLNKYISKMPIPYSNGINIRYQKAPSAADQFKCLGDNYVPEYAITTNQQKGFEDWANGIMYMSDGIYVSSIGSERCFSLK